MNRNTLIQNFSLHLPVDYHDESLERMRGMDGSSMRKAAVLIGCVEREGSLNVILTKRAKHLRHHPGQIAFPGGKLETGETLYQAAVREAEEEIGLAQKHVEIIGHLPELMTISQFMVTPIIAIVNSDYQAIIDHNEVDTVFEVPAQHLFDIEQLYSQRFKFKGFSHRIFAIPYKQHFIWGVTAQIIQALQIQLH